MTRKECECKILEALGNIVRIYHDYNPNGKYLTLTYLETGNDGYITANNRYWQFEDGEIGEDADLPINTSTSMMKKEEEAC